MGKVLALLRSPVTRWVFLAIAVALAVYAVAASWDELVDATARLSLWTLTAAALLSIGYVWCTYEAWRRILRDLGSPLGVSRALPIFGVSQLGKYVPGGVWNVVAAAELGHDAKVPRRRSVAAMAVAVVMSVVTGVIVGLLAVPVLATSSSSAWSWLVWLSPLCLVVLLPSVLNRLVGRALSLMRRPPLEHPLSWGGVSVAAAWSLAGWLLAGLQVWIVAAGLGMDVTTRTAALAVGGYALAWVVGFLAVVVPAGGGVREAILVMVLAGALDGGAVLLTVLVSRVLLTVVDLGTAGVGALWIRRRRSSTAAARDDDVLDVSES